MTERIGREELTRMFGCAAALIRLEHKRLSALDSVCGDGDHGTTMLRCVERLEQSVSPGAADWRATLRDAGWALLSVDGGASSSLLGTFLGGMADAPCRELDSRGLCDAFEAGLSAVVRQTRARPGDKTMMDALIPAVAAMRDVEQAGGSVVDALLQGARAARAGAEATSQLTARYGRAKYLGDKTRGHQDPGAASIALLFEGFYRGAAESKGESGNA